MQQLCQKDPVESVLVASSKKTVAYFVNHASKTPRSSCSGRDIFMWENHISNLGFCRRKMKFGEESNICR